MQLQKPNDIISIVINYILSGSTQLELFLLESLYESGNPEMYFTLKIVATHFFLINFIITFPFNFKYLWAEVSTVVEITKKN